MKRYTFEIDTLHRLSYGVSIEAESKEEAFAKIKQGEFPRLIDGDDDQFINTYCYDEDRPTAYVHYMEPPKLVNVEDLDE